MSGNTQPTYQAILDCPVPPAAIVIEEKDATRKDADSTEGLAATTTETQTTAEAGASSPTNSANERTYSTSCCCGKLLLSMTRRDFILFLKKVLLVVLVSYALVPLIRLQSDFPKLAYVLFLVVLHIFILIIYLYRVRFRQLDPDCKAMLARVLGLGLTIALLVAADQADKHNLGVFLVMTLVIVCIHTVVLLLLMVRLRYSKPSQGVDQVDCENGAAAVVQQPVVAVNETTLLNSAA